MALAYAHPQMPAGMQPSAMAPQAPRRAYIQTARGPIAYDPTLASAKANPATTVPSALAGPNMAAGGYNGMPSMGYGAGMVGGATASMPTAATGGMGYPSQGYYQGGAMPGLSGAGMSH